MESTALSFHNVAKVFPNEDGIQHSVLKNITFDVPTGQKIAIIGRSGSGKSTLLHLAAGIDVPSTGDIWIGGKNIATFSESQRTQLRRNQIGLVFQFFYLLPHLSVADNVALPDLIAGVSQKEFLPRVMELLKKVGLDHRAGDTVQKLSGGEMQRIALCRAILRKPTLLLADEPTGNLDDENSRLVMDLLFELTSENKSTLLYVTHSQELAAKADKTWTLHGGNFDMQ